MPDRTKVKVGDLVFASFWEGTFVFEFGEVLKESERNDGMFYIETTPDATGYLDDAFAVYRAVEHKGNLCIAPGGKLWCIPILPSGDLDIESTYRPEPEKVSNRDADRLYEIAKQLGASI